MGDISPAGLRRVTAELGSRAVETLFTSGYTSNVAGLRLEDGRRVVAKERADEAGRAASCVAAQVALASGGFPCPRPLTGVMIVDGRAVHAEEWRDSGEGPSAPEQFGELLARLVGALTAVAGPPPLPNPLWVRYDHELPGTWPDGERGAVPAFVEEAGARARGRLLRSELPRVLGHADWEPHNVGAVVHDWDSLAWLPEGAVAGFACGAYASAGAPTLPPIAGSSALLAAYERSRPLTAGEREVAWAASVWLAAHNARDQLLGGHEPAAVEPLREQAAERLARAGG